VSDYFPEIGCFKLKFKLFTYLKPGFQSKKWNARQDELLKLAIR
jgi:hypothetical protein